MAGRAVLVARAKVAVRRVRVLLGDIYLNEDISRHEGEYREAGNEKPHQSASSFRFGVPGHFREEYNGALVDKSYPRLCRELGPSLFSGRSAS